MLEIFTKAKTGPKPKTKAERQRELDVKYGKHEYKLLTYIHTSKPAVFKHKCGRKFELKRAESLFRGIAKCPCLLTRQDHRTLKSYNLELIDKRPGFECVKFNGNSININTYKSIECGHTYKQSFNSFNLSKLCPICCGQFGQKRKSIDKPKFVRLLNRKFKKSYKLIGEYINNKTSTIFQHRCGYKFDMAPCDIIRRHYDYCEKCNTGRSLAKHKIVTIDGYTFKMQGHEPFVLPKLIKQYGAKNIKANSPRKFEIKYIYNKIRASYYPDFYIPCANLVVEVKSFATLGLMPNNAHPFGSNLFRRMKAKALQVKKQGYKFRLYLMEGNRRIKLPPKWYTMSKKQVLAYIKRKSSHVIKQSTDYWRDINASTHQSR